MIISARPLLSFRNILDLFLLFFKRKKKLKTKLYFASNGSTALINILKNLKLNKKDKVLIPSYICESVPEILKLNKYKVFYYEPEIDGSINLKNLKNLILKNKIDAIILVNYFGLNYKNNLKINRNLKNVNCKVIHDCSHTFQVTKEINEFDGVFFSLKKVFPMQNLGAYFIKNQPLNNYKIYFSYNDFKNIIFYFFLNIIKNIFYFNKLLVNLKTKKIINNSLKNIQIDKIDYLAYFNLKEKKKLKKIFLLRKKNFEYVKKISMIKNQKSIFNHLDKNYIPQVYPILNPDYKLFNKIKNQGFKIYRWPGNELPKNIKLSKNFKTTKFLNDNIICIPIHELVKKENINKLFKIFH